MEAEENRVLSIVLGLSVTFATCFLDHPTTLPASMDQLPKDLIQRLPEFVDRHVKAAESDIWPGLIKNDLQIQLRMRSNS